MTDPSELDTAEFPLPRTDERQRASSSLVRVDIAAKSDKGKKRDNNEDHFLVSRAGRYLDTLSTNLPEKDLPARFDETGYIAVVADGMGGATGGEVASRLAITTLINIVIHVPDWILRLDEEHAQEVMRRAASYYREVNERLRHEARVKPELRGMGTTMTATYSVGDDLFVVHVGDSRAYLYRDGILRRLTRDHTHAQMLADAGIIRPEAVGTHRLRHVLTNALGAEGTEGNAEIHRMRLFDGDRVLLCTDGLHDMVEDERIGEILERESASGGACDALVQQALDNGGKDNVTVMVAGYSIPGEG
jgi:protein phosphatase